MEDIELLERVPQSLLKAPNVAYIVIDGMTLDKKMIIEKAKRKAKELLKINRFLSPSGVQELKEIIEL